VPIMDKNLLHDHDDRYDSDATAEELLEQRR
jgi:hypothetical protein